MRKLLFSILLSIPALVAFSLFNRVAAQEFVIDVTREYTVESDGKMNVTETHQVKNNSSNLVISKPNKEVFQITVITNENNEIEKSIENLEIKADGKTIDFQKNLVNSNNYSISVGYPRAVNAGDSITFVMTYTNYGLVEKTGALYDIYAQGFTEGFSFVKGQTKTNYKTKIRVSKSLPEFSFASPNKSKVSDSGSYTLYEFAQEDLVGNTIWIQLGKTQFYKFKITQDVTATENRDTGYKNEYKLILPRNIQEGIISQKVYFTKILPEPKQVVLDIDENVIGYFELPTHVNSTIVIEGYAQIDNNGEILDTNSVGKSTEIDQSFIDKYTAESEFWEVGAPEIAELATKLEASDANVFSTVRNTYAEVVNTIDYSNVKRFGLNERQGALKTLRGGSAVCMEYSDLFLTLTRAQGIPARAVFGYGYDPRLENPGQEAHQWVQVYMPQKNAWVSVDVTWGESGPALIGGDLNHFYTHVASINPNTPPLVEKTSYGEDKPLYLPVFDITVADKLPTDQALTQQDLLSKHPQILGADGSALDRLKSSIGRRFKSYNWRESADALTVVGAGISVMSLAILFLLVKNQNK